MKRLILVVSVVALILSVAWFITQPGYEPAITFFLGVAGIIGSHFGRSHRLEKTNPNNALLRRHRLEVRNVLLAFADFCLTYQALHPQTARYRTRELSAEIGRFKSVLDSLGPLAMPEFAPLLSDIMNHAWNFQRLLDRQNGLNSLSIDRQFQTLEDNLDGMVEWFADVKKRISAEIDPYLEI